MESDSEDVIFETRGSGSIPSAVFGLTLMAAVISPVFYYFLSPILPDGIAQFLTGIEFLFPYAVFFGFWTFVIAGLTGLSCLVFLNKLQVTEEGVSYKILGNETWFVEYDEIRSVDDKEEFIEGDGMSEKLKLNGEFGTKSASVADPESAASFIYDRV